MKKLINLDYNYVKVMNISDFYREAELYMLAMDLGYKPSILIVSKHPSINTNYEIMKRLININCYYVKAMNIIDYERDMELYELAEKLGYEVSIEDAMRDSNLYKSDKHMMKFVSQVESFIFIYKGSNIEIFKKALENGFPVPFDLMSSYGTKHYTINECILYLLATKDFSIMDQPDLIRDTDYSRIFKIAVDSGYRPHITTINDSTCELINIDTLREIIKDSSREECIELLTRVKYHDEVVNLILEIKDIDIDPKYLNLISSIDYFNQTMFIDNFISFSLIL